MSAGESNSPVDQINLHMLAERLAEIERRLGSRAMPTYEFTDQKLARIAASIFRARQRRLKHFDADLFGDPAWDMLLDLFVNQVRGVRVTVGSLGLAARVPQATGIRWIDVLVQKGLVRKLSAADDRRLTLVELTQEGFRKVRAYVQEGIGKFDMPFPDPASG